MEGEAKAEVNEKGQYSIYVINNGEKGSFDIISETMGISKTAQIDEGTGIRIPVEMTFTQLGKNILDVKIIKDGEEYNLERAVSVVPTQSGMDDMTADLSNKLEELNRLRKICKLLDISTDYEDVQCNIIEAFIKYNNEDFANNSHHKIMYTKETLDEIYKNAKSNMEAYIAGEKESFEVPERCV